MDQGGNMQDYVSSGEEDNIPEPTNGKPFNEEFAGFTDEELQTTCKVLATLHYRRGLLGKDHFNTLLTQGKLLFSPLR
jgi:hypothetical protein